MTTLIGCRRSVSRNPSTIAGFTSKVLASAGGRNDMCTNSFSVQKISQIPSPAATIYENGSINADYLLSEYHLDNYNFLIGLAIAIAIVYFAGSWLGYPFAQLILRFTQPTQSQYQDTGSIQHKGTYGNLKEHEAVGGSGRCLLCPFVFSR